jgi:hypothetical protein
LPWSSPFLSPAVSLSGGGAFAIVFSPRICHGNFRSFSFGHRVVESPDSSAEVHGYAGLETEVTSTTPYAFPRHDDPLTGGRDPAHERSAGARRTDLVCPVCGYRVVPEREPPRCPMCGGEEWELSSKRASGPDDAEPPGSSIR